MKPVQQRARNYVLKMPPSIQGSGGSDAAFKVATALVVGFELADEDAFRIIQEWNQGCQPPWTENDLRRKLGSARRDCKRRPGYLLVNDPRERIPTEPRPPAWFTSRKPTRTELEPFRSRRGLSRDAIACAVALGALRVGTHSQFGHVLAMAEGEWWQVRPLNAGTFRSGQKTMSAPGPAPKFFGGTWVGSYPEILLVEGVVGWLEGVDAVLRHGDAAWSVLAAYNNGSSFFSDLATAGALHGRRVTIVPDAGPVGAQAALRWRDELIALGIEVRIHLLPETFKDLGDLLKRDDAAETLKRLFQQPTNEAQNP
jgi:hypothetical protein